MSDLPSIKRQLKIKSGVAQRLIKENNLYRKEAEDSQRKLDKLKAEDTSDDAEWNIKNAGKILDESKKMIDDSSNRAGKAVEDLRSLVLVAKKRDDLAQDEDFLNAESVLEEVSV